MAPRKRLRFSVRVSSALTAVLVMFVYGYLSRYSDDSTPSPHNLGALEYTTANIHTLQSSYQRHLLSYPGDSYYELYGDNSKGNVSGCHDPLHPPAGYRGDGCQYVRDHCSGQSVLINYLSFIMCDLGHVKVRILSFIM